MSDNALKEKARIQKTIVIFGISSFVGSNLAEFLKKDYRVIGTYYKNAVQIPDVLTLKCDVLSKEEVQLILFAFRPDYVLYCVGVSSIEDAHQNEHLADSLNTNGLFNVSEYCQRYKAQICYISSGFIFAGEEKNYYEMDIPDSLTHYGKTQAAAEFFIQKTSLSYSVYRCCRLYGRGIRTTSPTWFENMQRRIHQNESLEMDDYVATGFLDISYLGMILKMNFDKGVSNRLFQISSRDILTMYEFSQTYAKVFQVDRDRFSRGRWPFPLSSSVHSVGKGEEKSYFHLDTENIEGFLNIEFPTVEESLSLTYERFHGTQKKRAPHEKGDFVKYI